MADEEGNERGRGIERRLRKKENHEEKELDRMKNKRRLTKRENERGGRIEKRLTNRENHEEKELERIKNKKRLTRNENKGERTEKMLTRRKN